jgi:putative transposase
LPPSGDSAACCARGSFGRPLEKLAFGNAVAERVFALPKFESLRQSDWHRRTEARRAVFRSIETWHNRKGRHSTLGYVNPADYEPGRQDAAWCPNTNASTFSG